MTCLIPDLFETSDIALEDTIFLESPTGGSLKPYSVNKDYRTPIELRASGYIVRPGQNFVAEDLIKVDAPSTKTLIFVPHQDLIRVGIDVSVLIIPAGTTGKFSLLFKNSNQQHSVRITPGMSIGRLVEL